MPKPTFEVFEVELQNLLYNLSDPAYAPEPCIYQVMEIPPDAGMQEIRQRVIEAIDLGVGGGAASETAKITFLYRVLQQRFVFSRSQEKAAEALDLSARHLRRKQSEAIRALAAYLWNQTQLVEEPARDAVKPDSAVQPSWSEMLRHEIEVLNIRSQGVTVDPARVIHRTIEMAGHLNPKATFSLDVADIPANLEIPIHPNVLRQVILYIIRQISHSQYAGVVRIRVEKRTEATVISFVTCSDPGGAVPEIPQIQELVKVLGGKVAIQQVADLCSLELVFPLSPRKSVMVIDDNYETAQLLHRYTLNTHYDILHLASGSNLLEQIHNTAPDLLVIDVLLPGQDGWDLLMQLRQDPETAQLPIIVSSVIGDPEIARSLGADAYLPKPVSQKDFLQALGRFL